MAVLSIGAPVISVLRYKCTANIITLLMVGSGKRKTQREERIPAMFVNFMNYIVESAVIITAD